VYLASPLFGLPWLKGNKTILKRISFGWLIFFISQPWDGYPDPFNFFGGHGLTFPASSRQGKGKSSAFPKGKGSGTSSGNSAWMIFGCQGGHFRCTLLWL